MRVFDEADIWIQAHPLFDLMEMPRLSPAPPTLFEQLSPEQLPRADADLLWASGSRDFDQTQRILEGHPLWPSMNAVTTGMVRYVEDSPGAPTTRTRRSSSTSTRSTPGSRHSSNRGDVTTLAVERPVDAALRDDLATVFGDDEKSTTEARAGPRAGCGRRRWCCSPASTRTACRVSSS